MATKEKVSLSLALASGLGSSDLGSLFWQTQRERGKDLPADGLHGLRTELVRFYRQTVITATVNTSCGVLLFAALVIYWVGDLANLGQSTALVFIPFLIYNAVALVARSGPSMQACQEFLRGVPIVMEALGLQHFAQLILLRERDLHEQARRRLVDLARSIHLIQKVQGPGISSVVPLQEMFRQWKEAFVDFGVLPAGSNNEYYDQAYAEIQLQS